MRNNFADLRGDAPETARNMTECRGDRKSPADLAQGSAGDASAARNETECREDWQVSAELARDAATNGGTAGGTVNGKAKDDGEQARDAADITLAELRERRIKAIKKEKSRLSKQFKEIDKKSRAVVDGLIEQAAFLRVQLQELADDININGTTELFAQGKDQEPYERQRPAANVYNSMNANYQKIIKQLNELLPKPVKNTEVKDGFRDFVNGRDVF